jgi:CRP-like cAMP-binding protein
MHMLDAIPRNFRNQLLSGLTPAQLARLVPHLEPVELPVRLTMQVPGELIEQVYFPSSGITSIVVGDSRGKRIEAGLFGRDGMSGSPVVMGDDRSPHEVFVQTEGQGHRMDADALREAMTAEPAIFARFLRFIQAIAVQVSYTTLANGQHTIVARLARWLLMCDDRSDGDSFSLTHEFLSLMLGVRRAGVTVATHELEGRGLIKATRGRIRILDRGGLETASDGAYGVPEAEYQRLLGAKAGNA